MTYYKMTEQTGNRIKKSTKIEVPITMLTGNPSIYNPAMTGGVPLTPNKPDIVPDNRPKTELIEHLFRFIIFKSSRLSLYLLSFFFFLNTIGKTRRIITIPKSFFRIIAGIKVEQYTPINVPIIPVTPKIKPIGILTFP